MCLRSGNIFKLILMSFHQMFCSFMFRGQMHIWDFSCPATTVLRHQNHLHFLLFCFLLKHEKLISQIQTIYYLVPPLHLNSYLFCHSWNCFASDSLIHPPTHTNPPIHGSYRRRVSILGILTNSLWKIIQKQTKHTKNIIYANT